MQYYYYPGLQLPQELRSTAIVLQPEAFADEHWDQQVEFRPQSDVGANDIYTIHLVAGSVIYIFTQNNYSPANALLLYDQNGDSLARDSYYSSSNSIDILSDFVAPYTGIYYINAFWNPNTIPGWAFIRVKVELPDSPTEGDDDLGGQHVLAAGGDDTVTGTIWNDYLRGGEGDDLIQGGYGFDDVHGNMGDDTVYGGQSTDWVVGGQGDDLLYGEIPGGGGVAGDLVLGNKGYDTLIGFLGTDTLRGGQDNDSLSGDAGADLLFGDRGDDTIMGGAGADTFYTFAGAGLDRVMDFKAAEGDRVRIEPGGGPHTVRQVGADTIIDLQDAQVILVGVAASSLPDGWLIAG